MIPLSHRSKIQTFFLIVMLGALDTITPVSIDMYLPAFPKIANDFHTSIGKVALSVSTYFFGFAFGQILYGPLLDRFGRKRPLYTGLILYSISSIGCITVTGINGFLFARFIQALSGCVASVAAMAMVRDFFSVKESAKIFSLMILVLAVSPLLAPTIGSFIVTALGWHYVFVLLVTVALLMLTIVYFFLPEGHKADPTVLLKPKPILNEFKKVLLEPKFYVFVLAGSFSFAGLFVYVAGSPAIFMEEFHVNAKVYGSIFAFLSVGLIGGSQLNHLLTRKYSSEDVFKGALTLQVLVAMVYVTGVINSWYALTGNIACLFMILLCAGITYPNAVSVALSSFSKNIGSASALLGFIQISIGALISSGVGLLNFKGSLSTSLIMVISSLIGLLILLVHKKSLTSKVDTEIGFSGQVH